MNSWQKLLQYEKQLGEHNSDINKVEIFRKREETNNKIRSFIITPFDGDHKNYAQYKTSIVDLIAKCFKDLLIADPPSIRNVLVWIGRPSATMIFSECTARDKLLGDGVRILPLFTKSQRMNYKKRVQQREDALFKHLSKLRNVGIGEQQKTTD
uniref:Uncharacterized protein n=1 Tax=Ditylenchus dipsaci TaxID=166011 RepID=A0A915EJ13_9BILA